MHTGTECDTGRVVRFVPCHAHSLTLPPVVFYVEDTKDRQIPFQRVRMSKVQERGRGDRVEMDARSGS